MRKCHLFSLLSLFLLLPASIIWAQTITSQKGLTTAVFTTQYGAVKIYLPDDIRPGDVISGTVVAEPEGRNARQTEKNLAELIKYSVGIDGNKFPVKPGSSAFNWLVHQEKKLTSPLELLHVSGYKAGQLTLQFMELPVKMPASPEKCFIPPHALTAAPLKIPGPFDGDMATTQCSLNNQPMPILAESPRSCVVSYPTGGSGINNLQVKENGQQRCARDVSGVQLNVSAGKLDLQRGEKTYVDVSITGLQGIPDTCTLTVTNATPTVVTMSPSNNVVIPLIPDSLSGGTFNRRFDIKSNRAGGFVVNVDLSMVEDWLNPYPDEDPSDNCNCSVKASIVKRTFINPRHTFSALAQKSCTGGQHCGEGTMSWMWEIAAGNENAEIVDDSRSKAIVTIQPKNSGKFILKLFAMNTCGDGTFCVDQAFCNENGDEVNNPAEEGKTEEPRQPTEPQKPKDPSSSCACDAGCSIKKTATNGNEVSYSVEVKALCVGTYGSGSTRSICTAGAPVYKWSIGPSGKDVAEIVGKTDGESVKVKHKKEGNYTLYVKGEVVCSDGTICEFICNWEQSIPPFLLSKPVCHR